MMKFNRLTILVIASFLVFACRSESNIESQKQPKLTEERMKKSPGKGGAPITMKYAIITQSPEAGQEIEVNVQFNSPIKSPVKAQLVSAKNLVWVNALTNFESKISKSGVRQEIPYFKVMAEKEGLFFIRLVASVEKDGQTLSKPFTIPVQIGKGGRELEKTGEVITDENGQTIVIQKVDKKDDN